MPVSCISLTPALTTGSIAAGSCSRRARYLYLLAYEKPFRAIWCARVFVFGRLSETFAWNKATANNTTSSVLPFS